MSDDEWDTVSTSLPKTSEDNEIVELVEKPFESTKPRRENNGMVKIKKLTKTQQKQRNKIIAEKEEPMTSSQLRKLEEDSSAEQARQLFQILHKVKE